MTQPSDIRIATFWIKHPFLKGVRRGIVAIWDRFHPRPGKPAQVYRVSVFKIGPS